MSLLLFIHVLSFGTYKYPCALENIYTHFSWDMLRCITVGHRVISYTVDNIEVLLNILNTRPLWNTYYHMTFSFFTFFFHFHLLKGTFERTVSLTDKVLLFTFSLVASAMSFLSGWFCLWYSMVLLEHEKVSGSTYIYMYLYICIFFPHKIPITSL